MESAFCVIIRGLQSFISTFPAVLVAEFYEQPSFAKLH